jgi:hypothetical protein
MEDHLQPFSWKNTEPLLGLPRSDPRIGDLFAQTGLPMDELWRDLRVGIDSMPPHDQEPASVAEIDLTPSYHVRLRFRHARLVQGARTAEPQTFVLAAMTYFLDPSQAGGGYQGDLPAGIEGGDSPSRIIERIGRPPSEQSLDPSTNHGFMVWEDRNPVLHVLLGMPQQQLLRVNVFLAPA